MSPGIPLRLGVVQRVLPGYRVPLFDALAAECAGGLGLFAGQARPDEMIESGAAPRLAQLTPAHNLHLLRGRFYLCWQRGLANWLESFDPQALIVEANPRYLSTPGAVRWMKRRGRPVIGWGLGAPGGRQWPAAAWRRGFLRQFDALLTYSSQGAEQYRALGFPPERVFVAPNAAASRPTTLPPDRPQGFAGGKGTVLFVGRLQARKRVDLLLRACAALPTDLAPRLVIVGAGPELEPLRALARQVYPAAEFTGALHGPELLPYLITSDLFVLPGTGGLALQQAMSAALPVIAAEADGTQADLVRPGNGWQLAPGDLEGLTRALAEALRDPARLRRMGLESYRIVRDEINLENMVAVFAQALRAVLPAQGAL